jgi:cobalt-zinc-cadmium efflux system outer membrane protein
VNKNYIRLDVIIVLLFLVGCAAHKTDGVRPDPRPLGKDIETYHPPYKPSKDVVVSPPQLEEPSGVISLRQALSLALMHNPELAAFSLEVRAGDAKALQASLFPNPELEAEVENFGGTEEWSRFDGAETKVVLRQLIEIGGKRSKRTKVASCF